MAYVMKSAEEIRDEVLRLARQHPEFQEGDEDSAVGLPVALPGPIIGGQNWHMNTRDTAWESSWIADAIAEVGEKWNLKTGLRPSLFIRSLLHD